MLTSHLDHTQFQALSRIYALWGPIKIWHNTLSIIISMNNHRELLVGITQRFLNNIVRVVLFSTLECKRKIRRKKSVSNEQFL